MATESPTAVSAQVCAYVSNGSVYAYLAHDYAPAGEPMPDLVKYYARAGGSTKLLIAPAVISADYDQARDTVQVTALGTWRDHPSLPQQPAIVEASLVRDAKSHLATLEMQVFALGENGQREEILFQIPTTRCPIVALSYTEEA